MTPRPYKRRQSYSSMTEGHTVCGLSLGQTLRVPQKNMREAVGNMRVSWRAPQHCLALAVPPRSGLLRSSAYSVHWFGLVRSCSGPGNPPMSSEAFVFRQGEPDESILTPVNGEVQLQV